MFDSPTTHSQIFAGFGHQLVADSHGTIRRHQASSRLSVITNAKRVYDEVNLLAMPLIDSNEQIFSGIDGQESENLFE